MYTPKGKETDTISKLSFCSSPLPYLKLQKHTEGPVSRTEIEYKICWLMFSILYERLQLLTVGLFGESNCQSVYCVTFTPADGWRYCVKVIHRRFQASAHLIDWARQLCVGFDLMWQRANRGRIHWDALHFIHNLPTKTEY